MHEKWMKVVVLQLNGTWRKISVNLLRKIDKFCGGALAGWFVGFTWGGFSPRATQRHCWGRKEELGEERTNSLFGLWEIPQ